MRCDLGHFAAPAGRIARPARRRRGGAILMEVVLALTLLVVTGTIIFSGLSASFGALDVVRMRAQAADLAVSKLSEIQMGQLELADDGPNEFEDENLADWTWRITTEPMEDDSLSGAPLRRVEVIIAHTGRNLVYRLVQLMPAADDAEGLDELATAGTEGGGP